MTKYLKTALDEYASRGNKPVKKKKQVGWPPLVPKPCECNNGTNDYGPHGMPSGVALKYYWVTTSNGEENISITYPCTNHLNMYLGYDNWIVCGIYSNPNDGWVQFQQERYEMTNGGWGRKWDVQGSNGDPYVVSVRPDGVTYGCSCPGWKYKKAPKPDCKHIKAMKLVSGLGNRRVSSRVTQDELLAVTPIFQRPVRTVVECSRCGMQFGTNRGKVLHDSIHAAEDQLRAMGEAVAVPGVNNQVEVEGEMFLVRGRKFRD